LVRWGPSSLKVASDGPFEGRKEGKEKGGGHCQIGQHIFGRLVIDPNKWHREGKRKRINLGKHHGKKQNMCHSSLLDTRHCKKERGKGGKKRGEERRGGAH